MNEDDDLPRQNGLAKWRNEGARLERQRRIAKRLLRRQEQQPMTAAVDVEARLNTKLVEQKDFLIECCGQALGQHTEQLRDELLAKIAMVEQLQDRYAHKLAAVEDVSNDLNKCTMELRKEFLTKVDELARANANAQTVHRRHLSQADQQFQALSELHARELAVTNSKMVMLERQVDGLIATLNAERQSEATRNDLIDGLSQLRGDIAGLKRNYNS